MLSSGRNWLRSNQPPRIALTRPQSSSQSRLPMALSHSLAMANCGWLSTSTRAACSQPRMIRASPPWGCRSTRRTNQRGTCSISISLWRSTMTRSSGIPSTRMLVK
ncbi:hypothetical protein D3C72_2204910 [compost metagenome]